MSSAQDDTRRAQVMGAVRRALRRGQDGDAPAATAVAETAVAARLSTHPRGPVPARAQLDRRAQLDLFVVMATEAAAKVVRVQPISPWPSCTRWIRTHRRLRRPIVRRWPLILMRPGRI